MTRKRYLTAQESAEMLGVSRATLYAYVSRGLIRSEEGDTSTRERRYHTEDVEKLAARKTYRRDPAKVAEDALHWGAPMLDSSLTLIQDHHLYYRGRDVVELAQTVTFEQAAALLWTGDFDDELLFNAHTAPSLDLTALESAKPLHLAGRMAVALAYASASDLAAYDLKAGEVARTGARITQLLTEVVIYDEWVSKRPVVDPREARRIAGKLTFAWNCPEAIPLIDAALILCADHELNASSFAARVAASAEANPYAVVAAGLAALTGVKHGGNTFRVEAFLREADDPLAAISEWQQRGERIPGFGHHLYPDGDPRASALLRMLRDYDPHSPVLDQVERLTEIMVKLKGITPNIDLALAALCRVLKLPRGTPLALFAVGRSAGWIAHAIEQYASGDLIRPRARYVGDMPSD